LAGGALLFPSLALLFRLFLGGALGDSAGAAPEANPETAARARDGAGPLLGRAAAAALAAGVALVVFASAWWAQAIGVASLFAFMVLAFVAVGPAQLASAPAGRAAHGKARDST